MRCDQKHCWHIAIGGRKGRYHWPTKAWAAVNAVQWLEDDIIIPKNYFLTFLTCTTLTTFCTSTAICPDFLMILLCLMLWWCLTVFKGVLAQQMGVEPHPHAQPCQLLWCSTFSKYTNALSLMHDNIFYRVWEIWFNEWRANRLCSRLTLPPVESCMLRGL